MTEEQNHSSASRQVALFGRDEACLIGAPLSDAAWTCWGEASDVGFVGDRYFEFRGEECWGSDPLSKTVDYQTWLARLDGEVTLSQACSSLTDYTVYPYELVTALNGVAKGCLKSPTAAMLALARYEGVPRVGVWGVAVDDFRSPPTDLSYLMGLFRYQGMPIEVPRASGLWDLSLLDDAPAPDFTDEKANALCLGYLLGRETALGNAPHRVRPDLRNYHHHALEEAA